jgi:hypothetical protein
MSKGDEPPVEVLMHEHFSNASVILVSLDGDRAKAVRLPMSQIVVEPKKGSTVSILMPAWLAEKEGLA